MKFISRMGQKLWPRLQFYATDRLTDRQYKTLNALEFHSGFKPRDQEIKYGNADSLHSHIITTKRRQLYTSKKKLNGFQRNAG